MCSKSYTYHEEMSSLHNYLNLTHCSEYKSKLKWKQFQDVFMAQLKSLTSDVKRITDLIADTVVEDLWHTVLVEGHGFEALIKYIVPGY